jgi:hypothetical protein
MTEPDYPAHPKVTVDADQLAMTFRPADIRVIKAITGRSPAELTQTGGDVDEGDKFQMLAFMVLRQTYPDEHTKTLWDLADQADIDVVSSPPDPSNAATTTG